MTPAPSSNSRNRRSATLANIPPPMGPPPPTPPEGHPRINLGHRHSSSHSAQSSFSSQSGSSNISGPSQQTMVYSGGPSSFAPPRTSFSSPRASPVAQLRSNRERSDTETWSDGAWRSIFDAALVKAQQAVQLDELQETALAANLYAQAANDLGRVIPMCSSEKKKQSMLAIQSIYLDRVSQLKGTALPRSPLPHSVSSGSFNGATALGDDGSNRSSGYRHSISSYGGAPCGDEQQAYQPQQYHPQPFQSPEQQHFQPPAPVQPRQDPYQLYQIQQQQQQHQLMLLQQQHQQRQQQEQQQQQVQQEKGFRLFGKKRSKTQPSASHPPELGQPANSVMSSDSNQRNSNINLQGSNGYPPYVEYTSGSTNDSYSVPYVAPPEATSSPPVVSPIFMTHSPAPRSDKSRTDDSKEQQQQPQEQTGKSSKWNPFGKKKSKSFSNNESSTPYNPQRESIQATTGATVPVLLPAVELASVPQLSSPVAAIGAFSQRNQNRHMENIPPEALESDYDDIEDRYYDDEDEDADPFYIADTKGRAQAFEGKDIGATEKAPKAVKEEPPRSREPLKQSASYSQKQSFSPNYNFPEHDSNSLSIQNDTQELHSEPMADEQAYTSNFTDDNADDFEFQDQLQQSYQQSFSEHEDQFMDARESFLPDSSDIADEATNDANMAAGATAESSMEPHPDSQPQPEPVIGPSLEKTKSKRTWYGKKKKENEKEKEKERFDDVAKLMDEALFGGGSIHKPSKQKLKEKQSVTSFTKNTLDDDEGKPGELGSQSALQGNIDDHEPVQSVNSRAIRVDAPPTKEELLSRTEEAAPEQQPTAHATQVSLVAEVPGLNVAAIPEASEIKTESGIAASGNQDDKFVVSDTPKRSMARHFSIFKTKKINDAEQERPEEGGPSLTRTTTNDDERKSMHSHQTQQSSHSAQGRIAAEMAAALAVRPKEKEVKKRESDEYVPYEYQEDLEGPLMERVEIPENREVIGFVMPVEENLDYTMQDNEEAALDSWDSWVSQLESFEKVLSDKGMKKEKAKKAKNIKEPKPSKEESSSPMGSIKANRSSIFNLGRSDTMKSRASTTLDLNAQLLDSRPLSMSTTLLDDPSVSPRLSFQSSKSGGSETPAIHAMSYQQPAKKRWWNPKRKDTNSLYRVSHAFSMADLDSAQDRHLSVLLQTDQVRSSDNLALDTAIMSMPVNLTEPSTPAPEITTSSKELPVTAECSDEKGKKEGRKDEEDDKADAVPDAAADTVVEAETVVETVAGTAVEAAIKNEVHAEVETEAPIASMPKAKAKSIKAKLLPISTPLQQLLKLQNAEELWQYVQQAKTYATSKMNKGDKRSASIALKRAQALEARWQEIMLEMASSDEDTDEILEDDEDEEEETSEGEEEHKAPIIPALENPTKEETAAKIIAAGPTVPIVPSPTLNPTSTSFNIPNTHDGTKLGIQDDDEDEFEAHRKRRNTISRSNSTPDKYSKYKINKSPAAAGSISNSTNATSSLAILTEEETNEQGELSVRASPTASNAEKDDGRLGPDATIEQLVASTNMEHLKFYIQRKKTDTVAKARSGSKFAALEGMKHVKLLQQRLADLLEAEEQKGAAEENNDEFKDAESKGAADDVKGGECENEAKDICEKEP
ncbi:hypothetical protein BGX28_008677 [Mortierella sp. GBA30]|nr:hypothetical protein BGX28_008677 [Mortierella sp. GBA30]